MLDHITHVRRTGLITARASISMENTQNELPPRKAHMEPERGALLDGCPSEKGHIGFMFVWRRVRTEMNSKPSTLLKLWKFAAS